MAEAHCVWPSMIVCSGVAHQSLWEMLSDEARGLQVCCLPLPCEALCSKVWCRSAVERNKHRPSSEKLKPCKFSQRASFSHDSNCLLSFSIRWAWGEKLSLMRESPALWVQSSAADQMLEAALWKQNALELLSCVQIQAGNRADALFALLTSLHFRHNIAAHPKLFFLRKKCQTCNCAHESGVFSAKTFASPVRASVFIILLRWIPPTKKFCM